MLEPWVMVALGFVGLAAGFVDAVAGGGGLIGIPALLAAGVPPVAALATNKVQASIGTSIAAFTYWRKGFVDRPRAAARDRRHLRRQLLGAIVVKQIDTSLLSYAVPVALILIAGYFLFAQSLTDEDRHARLDFARFVPLIGFVIGFYDGIFGPGTGTFFTLAFVALFGLGMTRAAGHTKVAQPHLEPRRAGALHPRRRGALAGRAGHGDRPDRRRLSRRHQRHPLRRKTHPPAGRRRGGRSRAASALLPLAQRKPRHMAGARIDT